MRAAHDAWVARTGDLGAIPEPELAQRFWPGGVQPMTPPPTVEPAGGAFTAAVDVTLRSTVEGASIAYTFDPGTGAHWLLYAKPLRVAASATLRARAVRYGWAESAEATARFDVGLGSSGDNT